MRKAWLVAAVLALGWAAGPARAQQPDYLTPEEVEKARETQEPNERVALFLHFAQDRLLAFEKALAEAAAQEAPDTGPLKDLLNSFIRAVDDSAESLETALTRGGVDLRKTRVPLTKNSADFLGRLGTLQKTPVGASEELRYDLEDAVEATQDLQDLGKQIPDAPIPPKGPVAAEKETGKEQPAQPGRPTLKRKEEPKPK